MKVRDIMTTDVSSCRPDTNVAEAAITMWNRDCGMLPVVTSEGQVIGVITDRDICMAVATKGRSADGISVREVSGGATYSCLPDDDVSDALDAMTMHQVRRVPVVDEQGQLKGVVSMNDVLLRATGKRGVTAAGIVAALKRISQHRHTQTGSP